MRLHKKVTDESAIGSRVTVWRRNLVIATLSVLITYAVATISFQLVKQKTPDVGATYIKHGNQSREFSTIISRLGSFDNASSAALSLSSAINSATGTLFHGEKVRTIAQDYERLFQARQRLDSATRNFTGGRTGWRLPTKATNCDKWNVVTTIFAPTEAIRRAAMLPGWCTVIVADTKTPKDYMEQLLQLHRKQQPNRTNYQQQPLRVENIHFLSVEDQQTWAEQVGGAVGKFIQAIPFKHFARKNIGYLYAIQLKANFVFDFDDDNFLALQRDAPATLANISGNAVFTKPSVQTPLPNQTHLEGARVAMTGHNVFNHHPLMMASVPNSWPRGFPLQYILDETTRGRIAYGNVAKPMDQIAVMQFCADGNPDVDAIHRLVHPLPMNFGKNHELFVPNDVNGFQQRKPQQEPPPPPPPLRATTGSLIVPSHSFIPYNAQATVHTEKSLWALFLPFTVPGRVSDIWRGYFAQALFRDVGLSIAMLPPMIVQDRNAHNYLADFTAESDLYLKAGKLIEFLSSWKSDADSIPERMEQLWIDLYERSYIELNDVKVIQLWLAALEEIRYKFPHLKRRRIANVALMGQFNYNDGLDNVMFWNQKWREVFDRIVIRGPFPGDKVQQLRAYGMDAYEGRNDLGKVSPMENLMRTLQQFQSTDEVVGVLYAHEDMLLNITRLVDEYNLLKADSIIANRKIRFGSGLMGDPSVDPRERLEDPKRREHIAGTSYSIHPNGTFSKIDGYRTNDTDELVQHLFRPPWMWWKQGCINELRNVALDQRSRQYAEMDGTFLVPTPGAASWDFLFVPKTFTDEFSKAAQLMVDHSVFLECAFPKIIDILRRKANATIEAPFICTSQGSNRGDDSMMISCLRNGNSNTVIHPYKIFRHGMRNWSVAFEHAAGIHSMQS